jgi:hypothetical protein
MSATINELAGENPANEFLKQMAAEIEKNPPQDELGGGHDKLMQDLTDLWKDAFEYQYHDFKNTKYATPKVALVNRLNQIAGMVKNGKYDN